MCQIWAGSEAPAGTVWWQSLKEGKFEAGTRYIVVPNAGNRLRVTSSHLSLGTELYMIDL